MALELPCELVRKICFKRIVASNHQLYRRELQLTSHPKSHHEKKILTFIYIYIYIYYICTYRHISLRNLKNTSNKRKTTKKVVKLSDRSFQQPILPAKGSQHGARWCHKRKSLTISRRHLSASNPQKTQFCTEMLPSDVLEKYTAIHC